MPKILIADDSQFMRTILKTILNRAGYSEIIEAQNGLEAVNLAIKEHPDLVILDIIMPQMDGMEALSKIDNLSKVIMVTAIGQEDMVKKALASGARDFVVKPFNDKQVLEIVRRELSE